MTTSQILPILTSLVADISSPLPGTARYQRLLEGLQRLFRCDACALLQLEGDVLIPRAVLGLSADTLGRRFRVADHPRLAALLATREPLRFDHDSRLPDPYDGLIEHLDGPLPVHDCMGCALLMEDRPWGVLTVDALRPGAFDGLEGGDFQALAHLAQASIRATHLIQRLEQQARHEHELNRLLMDEQRHRGEDALLGSSACMRALQTEIDTVAPSDLAVLIQGETGVGKELVARRLHQQSRRADAPFIAVNCATLNDTLADSELFGHVRGAFTGAVGERRGKFELADGGTLFLDEVGELPVATQAKLLRALQTGQLARVGSDREHQVDVRIIAATNRHLAQEVKEGRFRADLYHRLSVYPLVAPPLREREGDIVLLAGHFLELNRTRLRLRSLVLSTEARQLLQSYDWPGNVRELEHVMDRAALRAAAEPHGQEIITIAPRHLDILPPSHTPLAQNITQPTTALPAGLGLRDAVDDYQRQLLRDTLQRHGDNWASAARELRVDRANLLRLARRLGIRPEPESGDAHRRPTGEDQ